MSSTGTLTLGAPPLTARRSLWRRLRKKLVPGWPLAAVCAGYPLWWMLGVSQLMFLIATAVMALELTRRRHVLVPALFGVWLLFLACTLSGPIVAQVVAPGADPAVEASRYFTWAYRMTFFLVATVTVMYVCTLRVHADRIARILAVMFMVVVGGGWLGVVAPHLSFPSVTELLLPHGLTANPFIHDQVHPTPAELQSYLGEENARPSAPFSYANAWGVNYAVLLPFFVRSWVAGKSHLRRTTGVVVMLFSIVPVIYSLDRGLWAALIVMALFVGVRGALTGHVRLLAGLLLGLVLVAVVILATPLQGTIESRFAGHDSSEGRSNLGTLAVVSTATKSPVVGFGATRRVSGSFHSIAEGATAMCPLCTPPALGTQGVLWTVIFAFGLLGGLLFVVFFVAQFLRSLGRRSPDDVMSLSVLLVFLVTMPIYDFSYPVLVAVMAAVGLLSHRRNEARAETWAKHTAFMREHCRLLAAFVVAGGAAGGFYQYLSPPVYHATASLQIPLNRVEPGDIGRLVTLDEVAQVAQGEAVTSSVARSLGISDADVVQSLAVTATPNTRILHLTFTADSAARARAGAEASAAVLLDQRVEDLRTERAREVRSLRARSSQLGASLHEVEVVEQLTAPSAAVRSTLEQDLDAERVVVARELAAAETSPLDPGFRVGPVKARHDLDDMNVFLASGAELGLMVGVLAAWWLPRRRRLHAVVRNGYLHGIRVLASVDARAAGDQLPDSTLRGVSHIVTRESPASCFGIDGRPESVELTTWLNARCRHARDGTSARSGSVVVVASTRTRSGVATRRLQGITGASIDVSGLVLVRPRPGARRFSRVGRRLRVIRQTVPSR